MVLEIIARVAFVLLAVLGLTELCRLCLFWLMRTKRPGRLYYVISLHGHDGGAELALRHGAQRLRWLYGCEEKRLICVDDSMDEETRRICELLLRDLPEMSLCTRGELGETLAEGIANT